MPRARMQTVRVIGVTSASSWCDWVTVEQEEMTPCEKSKSIAMPGSY
jgi:hypothetical protein